MRRRRMWRWERIFFHFNGKEDVYYTLCSSMGGGNKAGEGGGGRRGAITVEAEAAVAGPLLFLSQI